MLTSIFQNDTLFVSSLWHILAGLVMGLLSAVSYYFSDLRKRPSKSFLVTMIVLPSVISVVITLVGSNMAKAISIAGVFALVRFRSVPGDSRDIFYVFLSMASGIAVGMECYLTGLALVIIIGLLLVIIGRFEITKLGRDSKVLKITIPENMNIKGSFDSVFEKYLLKSYLTTVKTTNMGTLFQLTYDVTPKSNIDEKAFLDELRVLNGNLPVIFGNPEDLGTTIL